MEERRLILIRHGQSEWNKKKIFTGWTDIELSEQGQKEAILAGQELKKKDCHFDLAFSSALKRSIQTMNLILKEMNQTDLPQTKVWQFNERHYGALQGKTHTEIIKRYGSEQVRLWRRSFDKSPPLLKTNPKIENKKLYPGLKFAPKGESLKDTQKRVLAFWNQNLIPFIKQGQSLLIVAHGNSLRALIKHLEQIPDHQIGSLEILTGRPRIYKLNPLAQMISKEVL